MSCEYCYGPKNISGKSTEKVKSVINKLSRADLDIIVLSGGEPLIRNDIEEILDCSKDKGLRVYLSTNGLLFSSFKNKIEENLDLLGLPLDGPNPEINKTMRKNKDHFTKIRKILERFKENEPDYKLKVGTVVTKINLNHITEIGDFLFRNEDVYSPDVWRLYEFSPLREGWENKEKFEISHKEFKVACERTISKFPEETINPLTNKRSLGSYIFVNPKLQLEILNKDKEFKIIGDLKEMKVSQIRDFKQRYSGIIERSLENREWIVNKDKKKGAELL